MLQIQCAPMTWPIGGRRQGLRGVHHLDRRQVRSCSIRTARRVRRPSWTGSTTPNSTASSARPGR
ncbi:hypothetical protein ACTMU2_27650 [Cupriavidus basilensis]